MNTPAHAATWTLEDLPDRQVTGAAPSPHMDDQSWAVSAPRVLVENTTPRIAAHELTLHLIRSRSYAERYGNGRIYDAAIAAVDAGAQFLLVINRAYRLRDVTLCTPTVPDGFIPHGPYQNCPACTPATYLSFTTDTLPTPPTGVPGLTPPIFPGQRATSTDQEPEHGGCEGHYGTDDALTSGVGIGEPIYCNGTCNPKRKES